MINFLSAPDAELCTGKPESYLVYILFDKDLYVNSEHSGIVPVGDMAQLTLLQSQIQSMSADGYFYTYVTNLAQTKVYYNNFTVHHIRGNILQISDYYPYGLAWSRPDGDDARMYQSKQWQQNEWGEGRGLEMYDFHARMYDPVLGRWHAPDPMNQFDSPYNAMGNNPVVHIDPDGMQVPWNAVLNAVGNFAWKTVERVGGTAKLGPGPQFKETIHTIFGKAAGGIQIASSMLAWSESSRILSEGQVKAGEKSASSLVSLTNITFQTVPTNTTWNSSSTLNAKNDPGLGTLLRRSPWGLTMDALKGLFGSAHVPPLAMPINWWDLSFTEEQVRVEKNAALNRESKASTKIYGSYTIFFSNGKKYHGKGPQSRMFTSALEHMTIENTFVTGMQWLPSANERQAHKDEYHRMQTDKTDEYPEGYQNPINYNIIQSWGKLFIKQDGY